MRQLTDIYGGNVKTAINRAIRAEMPGGSELLDAIATTSERLHGTGAVEHQQAMDLLMDIKEAMIQAIKERYIEQAGLSDPPG